MIGGGRFRHQTIYTWIRSRGRPSANTGSVISDVWGESGKTGKTRGSLVASVSIEGRPSVSIGEVASATGKGIRSWVPIAVAER